jgi:hypothetical protein
MSSLPTNRNAASLTFVSLISQAPGGNPTKPPSDFENRIVRLLFCSASVLQSHRDMFIFRDLKPNKWVDFPIRRVMGG